MADKAQERSQETKPAEEPKRGPGRPRSSPLKQVKVVARHSPFPVKSAIVEAVDEAEAFEKLAELNLAKVKDRQKSGPELTRRIEAFRKDREHQDLTVTEVADDT